MVFRIPFPPAARAGESPDLKFLKPVILPDAGLQLRVLPEAVEQPLPSPTVYTYERTDNVSTSRVEMYAPAELWRHGQQAAAWRDPHGNTLLIAAIRCPLPRGFPRPHVLPREYEARLAGSAKGPEQWSQDDLAAWVADFVGCEAAPAAPAARPPSRLRDLIRFELPGQASRAAYAFRLNPAAAGQTQATQTWFFALIEAPRVPPERAEQALRRQFLPYLGAPPLGAARAMPGRPIRLPPSNEEAGVESAELAASRRLVAASVANLKNWWYAETPHYILLSNLPSGNRHFVRELQDEIEILREAFAQMIPPRVPIRSVSVIRVFADASAYAPYVGPQHQWTFGLWVPSRKELVVRPPETSDTRTARAHLLRAIYHEAFHQYLFYALDQIETSAWFNEGHASLFENAEVRNGRVFLREDEFKVAPLQRVIAERRLDVPRMLGLSLEAFYAGDDADRADRYALAWGIVYYLRCAPVPTKPAGYAPVLDRYLDALWRTRDAARATAEAFAPIDLAEFTAELERFWTSDKRRAAARRNSSFAWP